MTRPERMLPATSIARHSRVNSSTTVRHFSCWPLAQASNTKSYAQTWPTPVAGNGRGRLAATRRRGLFLGTCSPCSRQRRCVRSGLMTCPRRARKTWMRRYPYRGYCAASSCITATAGASRCASRDSIAHRGSGHAQQRARSPYRSTSLAYVGDLLPAHGRAHHFFAATSFRISMSMTRSATTFLSRAFSGLKLPQSLHVHRLQLPKALAPGVDRDIADPVLLGHLRHGRLVRLAQDLDHRPPSARGAKESAGPTGLQRSELCSEIRRVRLSSSNVQNSHFEACHVDFGARSRGDVLSALVSAATIAFQNTACAFLRERPTRERAAVR